MANQKGISVTFNDSSGQFVKWVGKARARDGRVVPKCHYLGRDQVAALAKAIAITAEWKALGLSGQTEWPARDWHRYWTTVLQTSSVCSPLNHGLQLRVAEPANQIALNHRFLSLHDAFDQYIEYERLRAASQISWQTFFGIRCRVTSLKRHLKNTRLAEIGCDQVAQFVAQIASRPKSKYLGRKISVTLAFDLIKALRTAFDWFDLSGRWNAPKRFERLFRVRRRNLMTREERECEHRGIETFSIDELQKIMAAARTKWHRVIIGAALNFAMTQAEVSAIRRHHLIAIETESPVLEKRRDKTDIFCRWGFVFPEVAEGLRWVMTTHRNDLIFVGAGGQRLVDITETTRRDTIQHWWSKLVHSAGTRYLPFRFLRKTAADILRQLTDRDTSEAFLSHSNEGVSKFYTNHDWEKLAAGLRLLHQKLLPIFDVPEPTLLLPQKRRYRVVPALKGKTRTADTSTPSVPIIEQRSIAS